MGPQGAPILILDGCRVGRVAKVGTLWKRESSVEFDQAPIDSYFAEIAAFSDESKQGTIYKDPKQRAEMAWRIPCANITYDTSLSHCKQSSDGADFLAGYNYTKEGTLL